MRNYRVITYLLTLSLMTAIISGCRSNDNVYKYENGLKKFLVEQYQIDMSTIKKRELLFIDVSCEDCIRSKVEFLKSDTLRYDNLKVYILGDTLGSIIVRENLQLIAGYDLASNYHLYETGISLPLYVDIQDGKVSDYFFIDDSNKIDFITTHIKKK